jgi:hypothetical protein
MQKSGHLLILLLSMLVYHLPLGSSSNSGRQEILQIR